MHPINAVFGLDGRARIAARSALDSLGFEWGAAEHAELVVLDTASSRLRRDDIRLIWTSWSNGQLRLAAPDGSRWAVEAPTVPHRAADLPVGPMRAAIESSAPDRALLPRARYRVVVSSGRCLDHGVPRVEALLIEPDPDADDPTIAGAVLDVGPIGRARRAFQRALYVFDAAGVDPSDGDLTSVLLASAGLGPDIEVSSVMVPLAAGLRAADGFVIVLRHLTDVIEATWDGVVADVDPEFLHDLRVALRRTRALVAHAKSVLPSDALEFARGEFAWLGLMTGPTRDLDVTLGTWSRYSDGFDPADAAGLRPALDQLRLRRADAHAAMVDAMTSPRGSALLSTWRAHLATVPHHAEGGAHAERRLGRVVAKRLVVAHDRLLERGRVIDDASPAEQLHSLRKDAKQVRYVIECFGGIMPGRDRRRFVRKLKRLQDNLGAHQDAEVYASTMADLAAEIHRGGASTAEILMLGRLVERLDRVRVAERAAFGRRFGEFDAPDVQRSLDEALRTMR